MLKIIRDAWNYVFAPRDWVVYGDAQSQAFSARRWRQGQWEYRDATEREAKDALIWQAIR